MAFFVLFPPLLSFVVSCLFGGVGLVWFFNVKGGLGGDVIGEDVGWLVGNSGFVFFFTSFSWVGWEETYVCTYGREVEISGENGCYGGLGVLC